MAKITKGVLFTCLLLILLLDGFIGYFLFTVRSFPRLACWNIVESGAKEDFYWPPDNPPSYFYFDLDGNELSEFRKEIGPLIRNKGSEMDKIIAVGRHVADISGGDVSSKKPLKWDSPSGMLKQIKTGRAFGHCFHQAIIYSTYLSSLGIKSRLWALENEHFNGTAHSVTEVYLEGIKKWIFVDIALGFYVTNKDIPLSFLELREALLSGKSENFLVHPLYGNSVTKKKLPVFYPRLVKCAFLRGSNDFVNKYNPEMRYGIFSRFHIYLDKLPDNTRRGLGYLLGRRDFLVHFVDGFSKSLKHEIIIARVFFYFFVFSLISVTIILLAIFFGHLTLILPRSRSRRETRNR
jgi:hypothetical protein